MKTCPCGSKSFFDDCCGPIISGTPASTAEALVRSRYTAFVVGSLDHVERTHAPEIRSDFNRAEAERLVTDCEWHGLHIHNVHETGDTAEIAFVIRFRHNQKLIAKGSLSKFRRDDGHWYYLSNSPAPHTAEFRGIKLGRNESCHCNSGKKFKKCCGSGIEQSGA